jgi:serine/threonine protein kinase
MNNVGQKFPQVFGRYLLLRLLNKGGMGEVYLAKSGQITGFEKIVVIKRILPHLSSNPDFSKRFITEANIAIKLAHVNIAPVLEVGQVAGEYFLALEYVEGKDLRKIQSACHRQKKPLPPYFALLIVRDLLTGLSYAHRKADDFDRHMEIVHCDISPPNILVSYEGEVKIIDFGISKSVVESKDEEDEDSGQIGFGKLGYMAPEQILKGTDIEPRTDLYSAGVVLWELLTGKKLIPFDKTTPYKEIAKKVVLGDIEPPSVQNPNIDKSIDDLVFKALGKKPENRFQTASEFRDAIQLAIIRIAPTTNTEQLGDYLRELFRNEIKNEKDILIEAKQVDMDPYKSELTEAISETVSFALGDDWEDFTGPIENIPEPSNLSKNQTPSFIPSFTPLSPPLEYYDENTSKQKKRKKFPIILVVGVLLSSLLATGLYFILRTPNIKEVNLVSVKINDSKNYNNIDIKPPVMKQPIMDPVMKPIMVAMKSMIKIKNMRVMRIKKVMKYMRKPVMVKVMVKPPDDSKQKQKKLISKYMYLVSKYKSFKSSHGLVLAKQWRNLRNYISTNRKNPAAYAKMEKKLNQFQRLMKRYSK